MVGATSDNQPVESVSTSTYSQIIEIIAGPTQSFYSHLRRRVLLSTGATHELVSVNIWSSDTRSKVGGRGRVVDGGISVSR